MSNVLNGVLAFAGDKVAARAGALSEVAKAAASGWANGDVSLMVDTAKGCNKTRTGSAVGETLQAYADVIRAQRTGSRIALGEDAPAWRVQCFLPALPDNIPEGTKGKEFATALAPWGQAVAAQWGVAIDLHIQAAKDAADAKRAAGKLAKESAEKAAAGAVIAMNAETAQPEKMGPDIPSINDLQAQLDAVTTERDALRVGNAGLSNMVATLKAELLALTPLPPVVVPCTAFSDLSVNAREKMATAALWEAKDATDKASGLAALGTTDRMIQSARTGKKGKRQQVPA